MTRNICDTAPVLSSGPAKPRTQSTLAHADEGAGLGLPLSKALIEVHGGRLVIASRLGYGTTVAIRLPASRLGIAKR